MGTYNQKRHYNGNSTTVQGNINDNVRSARVRQNFKRRQTHNHSNTSLMESRNQDDDEEEDFEIVQHRETARPNRKNDLVKETVAVAVFQRAQHADERSSVNENSMVTVNEDRATQKAASFFKKLFG